VLSAPVVIDGRRQALAKDIPPRGGKWNAKLGTEEDTVSSETDNPAVEEIELANHQPDSDVPRCRECGDKAEVTEHPDGEPEYCLPCWRVIRALRARRRSEVSVNETRITLPCLSVRPPWAQAIVAGVKDVENRSWKTRYRGPVLIHASQRFDPSAHDLARCLEEAADPRAQAFRAMLGRPPVSSAIIGVADLRAIVRDSDSPWAEEDMFHWRFENPRSFAQPIAGAGRLRLWQTTIPARVLATARRQS